MKSNPKRPQTWDELRNLPREKALRAYRHSISRAIHNENRDYLITELFNPSLWADMADEPETRNFPGWLIIACLPEGAHESSLKLDPEMARFAYFTSADIFIKAWLRFLETKPPPPLINFLRIAPFADERRIGGAARRLLGEMIPETMPYLEALDELEKSGLLAVLGAGAIPWDPGTPVFSAVPSDLYERLKSEHDIRMGLKLDRPTLFLFFLPPVLVLGTIAGIWGDGWGQVGMVAYLGGIGAWVMWFIKRDYRRLRRSLFDWIIRKNVHPEHVLRLLSKRKNRLNNISRHTKRIVADSVLWHAHFLRKMATRRG